MYNNLCSLSYYDVPVFDNKSIFELSWVKLDAIFDSSLSLNPDLSQIQHSNELNLSQS